MPIPTIVYACELCAKRFDQMQQCIAHERDVHKTCVDATTMVNEDQIVTELEDFNESNNELNEPQPLAKMPKLSVLPESQTTSECNEPRQSRETTPTAPPEGFHFECSYVDRVNYNDRVDAMCCDRVKQGMKRPLLSERGYSDMIAECLAAKPRFQDSAHKMRWRSNRQQYEVKVENGVNILIHPGTRLPYLSKSTIFDAVDRAHLATKHGNLMTTYAVMRAMYHNALQAPVGVYIEMCALCNQRRLRYVNAKFRIRDPLNSPHQRFNNKGSTVNNSRQKIDDAAVERALVELGVEPGPLPGLC